MHIRPSFHESAEIHIQQHTVYLQMSDANGGMLELSSAPGINTLSFEQVRAQNTVLVCRV